MTAFSERLRRLRQDAGLTQRDLAGETLSAGYISLLEQGKRSPSDDVVAQLAVRLGCSTTQLLVGEPSERDQRIELERAYARLAIEHGESAEARKRLERLLAEDGLPIRVRDDLKLLLGMACERTGDLPAAVRVFQDLLDRACRQETHLPVTLPGIGLLRCYLDGGDLHEAVVQGEAAMAAAQAQRLSDTDDYYRLAATVMAAYMDRGDYLRARVWGDRYLQQALERGHAAGQSALYWNAALLAEQEGRLGDALALCERALGLSGELATVRDTPRLQLQMAALLLRDDPPQADRASELLEHCADVLQDLGSRADRARWHWLRATADLLLGELEAAEAHARLGVELGAGGGPQDRAEADLVLSDVLAAQGRPEQALEPLLTAFARLVGSPQNRSTALQWREVAERLLVAGRVEQAVDALRQALDGAGVRARNDALARRIRELAQTPATVVAGDAG